MDDIKYSLGPIVRGLSDENYEQSLAFYRLWVDIGRTYSQIPSEQIFDTTWNNRTPSSVNPSGGQIIHPAAHLVSRFANDTESDRIRSPRSAGPQSRPCARVLQGFFEGNMTAVRLKDGGHSDSGTIFSKTSAAFITDANLVAHWVNLGFVEEVAIRNHVLQSLIYHSALYNHQAEALIVLFKVAGAAFEAYAEPGVVDRCFELLKNHCYRSSGKTRLRQASAFSVQKVWN